MFWAANPYPALHHTLVWGAYLIFFLLLEQVAARPRLLYASIAMLGVLILIIGIACIIGYLATPLSLFRNNGLGEPLAVVVPLFAALTLGLRQRRAALFCGATAVVAWMAMLQMSERASFIATTTGLVLLGAFALAIPRFRPRSLTRTFSLAAAFIAVLVMQSVPLPFANEEAGNPPPVFSRMIKEMSPEDLNTRARFLFWGAAIEMAREHPVTGIGADNYDVAFADARARFSARNPSSSLVEINEGFLAVRAHNEYLQILAELGAVGLALFLSFVVALLWAAFCALRRARNPLVPGAIASLAVFAISSGASSVSFRWVGSGLVFFFAVALISRFANTQAQEDYEPASISFTPIFARRVTATAFIFSLVMLLAMCAQSLNVLMNGAAQASADAVQAENRFRSAIFWNPYDAAAHFNYGTWLYFHGRANEGTPHIRYGVENGINTSTCYLYLAAAEAESGDLRAAEATIARAIEVYPRSVFLRIRHASALASLGRSQESQDEYAKALSFNSAKARGWWQLICFGKGAASEAAIKEPGKVELPGDLMPLEAVHFVIAENKRRPPNGCSANLASVTSNTNASR